MDPCCTPQKLGSVSEISKQNTDKITLISLYLMHPGCRVFTVSDFPQLHFPSGCFPVTVPAHVSLSATVNDLNFNQRLTAVSFLCPLRVQHQLSKGFPKNTIFFDWYMSYAQNEAVMDTFKTFKYFHVLAVFSTCTMFLPNKHNVVMSHVFLFL